MGEYLESLFVVNESFSPSASLLFFFWVLIVFLILFFLVKIDLKDSTKSKREIDRLFEPEVDCLPRDKEKERKTLELKRERLNKINEMKRKRELKEWINKREKLKEKERLKKMRD